MAYQVPINQPLTETQNELMSKVSSMKNLVSLDFFKQFTIPKDEQVSTLDYILKVMRSMGIDPVILLKSFISSFLETDKLVDFVFRGSAQMATALNLNLDSNSNIVLDSDSSNETKKGVNDINYNYLSSNAIIKDALTTVVEGLKMQLIKDLMTLIFGAPKKQPAIGIMSENQEPGRMEELNQEIYCGGEIFSTSAPVRVRNEDLEFNRINLRKNAEAGKLGIKVSCQGMEITFPENPAFLFTDALPGIISSSPVTPAQALTNCINQVENQTQTSTRNNGNSKSVGKDFSQMILEKLIVHIVTLTKPFFMGITEPIPNASGSFSAGYDGIFAIIQADLINQGRGADAATFNPTFLYPPSSCEIISWGTPSNWTASQKKKTTIFTILCNMVLNAVLGFLLAYLITKVKSFIAQYLANRAVSKAQRKLEKLEQTVGGGSSSAAAIAQENADKTVKQVKLLVKLKPVLDFAKNLFV